MAKDSPSVVQLATQGEIILKADLWTLKISVHLLFPPWWPSSSFLVEDAGSWTLRVGGALSIWKSTGKIQDTLSSYGHVHLPLLEIRSKGDSFSAKKDALILPVTQVIDFLQENIPTCPCFTHVSVQGKFWSLLPRDRDSHNSESESVSCWAVSDSLWPHGL